MKKREIIILVILILFAAAAAVFFFVLKQEKGPLNLNIMVMTLDTTRADHIGIYGSQEVSTPNIDHLAANGIYFKNCYAPVPLTLPSHCSLFTGQYPIGHNVRNNGRYALQKDELTMAEFFKKKGYHNFAVIASYVLLSKFGLNQGFDIYEDSLNSKKMLLDFYAEIPADQVYEKFKKWFSNHMKRKNKKKFFAWVHFFDPHAPYEPPSTFAKKEDKLIDRYRGEISYMDTYIGKIISDLKTEDILDETLIVIVGDHGEAFGEHTEYGHGVFCYEEVLRVPLIFFNKRFFKGEQVVDNRVSLVDIFPTIIELYGEGVPGEVQGESFAHLLRGESENKDEERVIYFESMYGREENNWAPLTGIIDHQYKYCALPQPELYDLYDDPTEKANIYKKKHKVSRRCDEKLKDFLLKYSIVDKETKRELSGKDVAHLESLGYISKGSGKSANVIDPKIGIALDIKLKVLDRKVRDGYYDEAEEELKALLADDSPLKHPAIYILLDKIYVIQKNRDAALKNLHEGIKVFPNSDELNFRIITKLYEDGEYEKAIEYSTRVLEKNPYLTHAHTILGDIYLSRQEYEKAVSHYRQAAEMEPENVELNFKYAKMLIQLRKFDEALPVYERLSVKEEFQKDHDFLYWFAMYHYSYGSSQRAEELIRKAIHLNPNGNSYFYYALILAKNLKFKEAVKNMEIAIGTYPHQLSERQRKDAWSAIATWKESIW